MENVSLIDSMKGTNSKGFNHLANSRGCINPLKTPKIPPTMPDSMPENEGLNMLPIDTFSDYNGEKRYVEKPPWFGGKISPREWFEQNFERFIYSPKHIIQNIVDRSEIEPPQDSGIYFLINDGQIDYVGISNNISRRFLEHEKKGLTFSQFWCFGGVPEFYISYVEAMYIAMINPPLNNKWPNVDSLLTRYTCPAHFWT
jgi:hypothetical protein